MSDTLVYLLGLYALDALERGDYSEANTLLEIFEQLQGENND